MFSQISQWSCLSYSQSHHWIVWPSQCLQIWRTFVLCQCILEYICPQRHDEVKLLQRFCVCMLSALRFIWSQILKGLLVLVTSIIKFKQKGNVLSIILMKLMLYFGPKLNSEGLDIWFWLIFRMVELSSNVIVCPQNLYCNSMRIDHLLCNSA